VKLFVEGGGDSHALRIRCREAFNGFLQKAGLEGQMPRIVACGKRNNAYESYCTALSNGEDAVLLVDSEGPVVWPPNKADYNAADCKTWRPWHHLKNRKNKEGEYADNWDRPQNALDTDCHLMVQFMETWFLADTGALREYYKQGFDGNCLPTRADIENIDKSEVERLLRQATKETKKGCYDKGEDSFAILRIIDANKVIGKSPWAKRFVALLKDKMQSIRETGR
jgi:hypothetical protein